MEIYLILRMVLMSWNLFAFNLEDFDLDKTVFLAWSLFLGNVV